MNISEKGRTRGMANRLRVFRFIKNYMAEFKEPPRITDVSGALGLSSFATGKHMHALVGASGLPSSYKVDRSYSLQKSYQHGRRNTEFSIGYVETWSVDRAMKSGRMDWTGSDADHVVGDRIALRLHAALACWSGFLPGFPVCTTPQPLTRESGAFGVPTLGVSLPTYPRRGSRAPGGFSTEAVSFDQASPPRR